MKKKEKPSVSEVLAHPTGLLNSELRNNEKNKKKMKKKSKPSDTEQHKRTEVLAHPTGLLNS